MYTVVQMPKSYFIVLTFVNLLAFGIQKLSWPSNISDMVNVKDDVLAT